MFTTHYSLFTIYYLVQIPFMKPYLFLAMVLALSITSHANDITVTNATTIIDEGVTFLQFDLSWKNSWRMDGSTDPLNYDAAWIFAKYKDDFGYWHHIPLSGSHNNPGPYLLVDTSDGLGYFIYRNPVNVGTGDISISNIRIGIDPIPGTYELRIFAVEMVFIPSGAFQAGDGNGTTSSTGSLTIPGLQPVPISTALKQNVKSLGAPMDDAQLSSAGIGIDGDDGLDNDNNGTIDNPLYPTGYNGFYCMKYELSQRGLVDFFNTLTYPQQGSLNLHPDGETTVNIGDIAIETLGQDPDVAAVYGVDGNMNEAMNETDDNEWSAARDIDWTLLAAWLDWAALRPMTDLEFEKICRGTAAPITGEYVWGSVNIVSSAQSTINDSQTDESIVGLMPDGNANYGDRFSRILRCGIFADESSTRKSSGAAFYGPMDMGGNVAESVVTIGNAAGRSFTGKLGDGKVSNSGYANVDRWPGVNGNNNPDTPNGNAGSTSITGYAGIGVRGGDYTDNSQMLRLSNRQNASNMMFLSGGRGVR